MNENIAQEILHELFSSLEALETKSTAILQFLKDKGIATEQELAPYLEQAGNASSVRWRAAQVRIDHLLAGAIKTAEQEAKKNNQEAPKNTGTEQSRSREGGKDKDKDKNKGTESTEQVHAEGAKAEHSDANANRGRDNRESDDTNRETENADKNAT